MVYDLSRCGIFNKYAKISLRKTLRNHIAHLMTRYTKCLLIIPILKELTPLHRAEMTLSTTTMNEAAMCLSCTSSRPRVRVWRFECRGVQLNCRVLGTETGPKTRSYYRCLTDVAIWGTQRPADRLTLFRSGRD